MVMHAEGVPPPHPPLLEEVAPPNLPLPEGVPPPHPTLRLDCPHPLPPSPGPASTPPPPSPASSPTRPLPRVLLRMGSQQPTQPSSPASSPTTRPVRQILSPTRLLPPISSPTMLPQPPLLSASPPPPVLMPSPTLRRARSTAVLVPTPLSRPIWSLDASPTLPVVRKMLDTILEAQSSHPDQALDFSNVLLVGVQHFLGQDPPTPLDPSIQPNPVRSQTPELIGALLKLGISPNNIFFADKMYSTDPGVLKVVLAQGIHMLPGNSKARYAIDRSFKEQFDDDISALWEQVEEHLNSHPNLHTLLLLDDGGRSIVRLVDLLQTLSSIYTRRHIKIAAVEQTSAGMDLIIHHLEGSNGIKKHLTFPVVLLCASALKKTVESPLIADSLADKAEHIVFKQSLVPAGSQRKGTPFFSSGADQSRNQSGKRKIGIVGLGNVGLALAQHFTEHNSQECELYLYSVDLEDKISELEKRGISYTGVRNMQELVESAEIIMGCTGHDMGAELFRNILKMPTTDQEFHFSSWLEEGGDITPIDDFISRQAGSKCFMSCSSENIEFLTLTEYVKMRYPLCMDKLGPLDDINFINGWRIVFGCYPVGFRRFTGVPMEDFQLMTAALLGSVVQARVNARPQQPIMDLESLESTVVMESGLQTEHLETETLTYMPPKPGENGPQRFCMVGTVGMITQCNCGIQVQPQAIDPTKNNAHLLIILDGKIQQIALVAFLREKGPHYATRFTKSQLDQFLSTRVDAYSHYACTEFSDKVNHSYTLRYGCAMEDRSDWLQYLPDPHYRSVDFLFDGLIYKIRNMAITSPEQEQNLQEIEKVLNGGYIDINSTDNDINEGHQTLLHVAVSAGPNHFGHLGVTQLLVARGIDVTAQKTNVEAYADETKHGRWSAMHFVARANNVAIAVSLLKFLPREQIAKVVNCQAYENETPLHIACYFGCVQMAGFLLDNGADHKAITNGKNPLDMVLYSYQNRELHHYHDGRYTREEFRNRTLDLIDMLVGRGCTSEFQINNLAADERNPLEEVLARRAKMNPGAPALGM